MKALYERLETVTGLPGLSPDLAWEVWQWFDDRLVQDDVLNELGAVFPDASVLLAAIAAVSRAVKQP